MKIIYQATIGLFLGAILVIGINTFKANHEIREELLDLRIQLLETEMEYVETRNRIEEFMSYLGIEVVETSAYAPLDNVSGMCADGNPYITALGTRTRVGVLAVNQKLIPYGTKIFIPGYGWGIAEDYCPYYVKKGVKGIDMVVMTYEEAITKGRDKQKTVLVVRT